MGLFYAIIALLAVASIVLLVIWLRQRDKLQRVEDELLAANTSVQSLEASLLSQTAALDAERRARESEQMARVKAETELDAERRLVAEKARSQQEVEQAMREQFKALAGDVLGEQSRRFKEENRESIDLILKPFTRVSLRESSFLIRLKKSFQTSGRTLMNRTKSPSM